MRTRILLIAILFAIMPFAVSANEVSVSIEGVPVVFEGQGAAIVDGRTLVPVRGVFEMLGFDVSWNGETRTVSLSGNGFEIDIQIDSRVFTVNGETRQLDVAAQIINERTMLPIRALIESVGLYVGWDAATSTVLISATPFEGSVSAEELIAIEFMNGIKDRDFEKIAPIMSEEMQAIDLDSVLFSMTGSVLSYVITDKVIVGGLGIFEVTVNHTIGTAVYTLIVSDGLVNSFSLLLKNFAFESVPVAINAAYSAEAVTIGTEWRLDGFLTIPKTATAENPVPAVVLVHGSGAHNMDSSIFDNRPFWDIADHLSSNGIAVVRYNKRNYTHYEKFYQNGNITVWDETINDAVLAAELLRADERISQIYVIGLSLGGMLAPKIAEEANLDGAILLAGSPRPLYEISYDQNIQLFNDALIAGTITHAEAESYIDMVNGLLVDARAINQLSEEELADAEIFGLPGRYQLSIVNALPLPIITASERPTLILQGSRDFQVTAKTDFRIFLEETENLSHVTTRLYENLNHLFQLSTTSYNDLREYMPISKVDQQVLRDIVEWILQTA